MISFNVKGDFKNTTSFFERAKELFNVGILNKYGRIGVSQLSAATPRDTGKTAASWSYKIKNQNGVAILEFDNSNINKGVPIAVILQYGHGTKQGAWVEGVDYINPALAPIFEDLAESAWREVTK